MMNSLFRAVFFLAVISIHILNVQCASYKEELLAWVPPKELQKAVVYYLSGYDDEERPIWVMESGKSDIRSILENGTEWRRLLDKYIDQGILRQNESVISASTPEKPVDGYVLIIDMAEYNLHQFSHPPTVQYTLEIVARLVKSGKTTIHKAYIINGNLIGEQLFQLTKPFLGSALGSRKVEFFGTNAARWKPKLLKHIPKSQLQKWYGGTATPDKILKAYG